MHDVFFFTDIHGMYNLYRAIMDYCNEQDPEATIIFGGDACDRGPDGYKIMNELLDNPKVIYLMGNHEDLFVKAAKQINELFNFKDRPRKDIRKILRSCMAFDYKYLAIQNSIDNGGMSTLLDWIEDGKSMEFVEKIEKLPYTFSYENCDFCHAAGVYKTFKEVADAEYNGTKIDSYYYDSLIWSRSAFNIGWTPNRIAIFGHTPIPYLFENLEIRQIGKVQPYKYIGKFDENMNGAKIDMDTGAAFLNRAFVLNVLTMKSQGFELKDNNVEKIECIQM